MIKDNIENLDRYKINDYFEDFKKLISNGIKQFDLPLKSIPLEYYTKVIDEVKYENHKRYIDIHYIYEGQENIGINIESHLNPIMTYDESGDYQLFEGFHYDMINLKKGEFLILFPGEVHATGIMLEKAELVKKIVYKVPLY